ncbi:hypothetical protein AB0939_13135 [Streptomyces sp. NPDC006990]|uniref:hypothetical protein n=1 Tax=Streptomyces sp. NPDC006990 TaxID=3154481 RepID=UPI003456B670
MSTERPLTASRTAHARNPRAGGPAGTVPGVPAWARRAAAAVVWVALPSGLWRVAVVLGVPLGLGQAEYDSMLVPGWGLLGLPLLSLLQEGLAWLTLGLVRSWGEVWPRWLPFLGGRPVPVWAAVGPAAFGAMACSVYGVLLLWTTAHAEMDIARWGKWLLDLCYVPMIAWGPLLAAVTVHYYRRRTRAGRHTGPARS